jgi:hypothetical protein
LLVVATHECEAGATTPLERVPDSSRSIARQIEWERDQRVGRILANGIRSVPDTATVSVQQARIDLGQNYPPPSEDIQNKTGGRRVDLDAEEVEEHPMTGIPEGNLQAKIPFGLAGVAWGLRHPSDVERLVLPIQN